MGRLPLARPLTLALALVLAACATPGGQDRPSPSPSPDRAPGTAAPTGWFPVAEAPLPLTEVAAAAYGGALWVVGGLDTRGQAARDVQVYDPDSDTWDHGPELPETLHHTALVATPDGLMVLGGYRGPGFDAPTAAVWLLDSETGDWREGPPLPEARAAGAAAWDGERLVYGGGVGPDREPKSDVFVHDGGSWSRIGALSGAREHLAAASDGAGRTWFLGGRRGGLSTNTGAVELVERRQVSAVASLPTPRGGAAAFHHPEIGPCLVGGESSGGTFNQVECVGPDQEVVTLPPLGQARHGLGVALLDGIAFAALGGPAPGLSSAATLEALRLDASQ